MDTTLLWFSLVLFVVPVLVGGVTLLRPWSDELLHLFLSFGTGIFLGAVFVHLLPEAMAGNAGRLSSLMILGGFLLIFFVERFLISRGEIGGEGSHQIVSVTAFIGLSLHSLIEGLALALGSRVTELRNVLFASILAHKAPAAFALGSLLALAGIRRRSALGWLMLFAVMTPLGAVVLSGIFGNVSAGTLQALTGLVTGSFMYVATVDLLPEVFHSPRRRWLHLLLLLGGIAAMLATRVHFGEAA